MTEKPEKNIKNTLKQKRTRTGFDPRFRRRRRLLSWVEQTTGREVVDLAALWRDGTILCDVIHHACPSSCQGWEDSRARNTFRHAQALAYRCLLVQPVFTEGELSGTELTPHIEKRLFRYLHALRQAACKRHLQRSLDEESGGETHIAEEYIARGMGLIMGSRIHRAIFYIYSRDGSSLVDIHIEIQGPGEDFGSVLITQNESFDSQGQTIPIEYRLTQEYLRVSYQPRSVGHHELSISRHGYIIPGSPFVITVDDISEKLPKKRFNSIEWYSEDEERRQNKLEDKRKNAKVKCRIVDFVTEKMYLTDDGKLLKIPERAQTYPSASPPDFPAPAPPVISEIPPTPSPTLSSDSKKGRSWRSVSPRLRKKKSDKFKWTDVRPDVMKYIVVKPQKAEVKKVSDAASQATLELQPNAFQEKCKRIVTVCDYLLQHCPRQTSLDIISGAGHILQSGQPLQSSPLKTSLAPLNIRELSKEDDDVFLPASTPSTVKTIMYPERCRSVSLTFVNDGINDISSVNNTDPQNEDSAPDSRRDSLTSHSASLARMSYRMEGNTKSARRRSSFSSISQNNDSKDQTNDENNYDDLLATGDNNAVVNNLSSMEDTSDSEIKLIRYIKHEGSILSSHGDSEKQSTDESLKTIADKAFSKNENKNEINKNKENKESSSHSNDKIAKVSSIDMDEPKLQNNTNPTANQQEQFVKKIDKEDQINKKVSITTENLVGRIIAKFETSHDKDTVKEICSTISQQNDDVYKQRKIKIGESFIKAYNNGSEGVAKNRDKQDITYDELLHIEYLKSLGASKESLSTIKSKIDLFERKINSDSKKDIPKSIVSSGVRESPIDLSLTQHIDDSSEKVERDSKSRIFRAEPAVVVSKHYAELREISVQSGTLAEAIVFDFQPQPSIFREPITGASYDTTILGDDIVTPLFREELIEPYVGIPVQNIPITVKSDFDDRIVPTASVTVSVVNEEQDTTKKESSALIIFEKDSNKFTDGKGPNEIVHVISEAKELEEVRDQEKGPIIEKEKHFIVPVTNEVDPVEKLINTVHSLALLSNKKDGELKKTKYDITELVVAEGQDTSIPVIHEIKNPIEDSGRIVKPFIKVQRILEPEAIKEDELDITMIDIEHVCETKQDNTQSVIGEDHLFKKDDEIFTDTPQKMPLITGEITDRVENYDQSNRMIIKPNTYQKLVSSNSGHSDGNKTVEEEKHKVFKSADAEGHDTMLAVTEEGKIFEDTNDIAIQLSLGVLNITEPVTSETEEFKKVSKCKINVIELPVEIKNNIVRATYVEDKLADGSKGYNELDLTEGKEILKPSIIRTDNIEENSHKAMEPFVPEGQDTTLSLPNDTEQCVVDFVGFDKSPPGVENNYVPVAGEDVKFKKSNETNSTPFEAIEDTTMIVTGQAENSNEAILTGLDPFILKENTTMIEPSPKEAKICDDANNIIINQTIEVHETTTAETNTAKIFEVTTESIIKLTLEAKEQPIYEAETIIEKTDKTIKPSLEKQEVIEPATKGILILGETIEFNIEQTCKMQVNTELTNIEANTFKETNELINVPTIDEHVEQSTNEAKISDKKNTKSNIKQITEVQKTTGPLIIEAETVKEANRCTIDTPFDKQDDMEPAANRAEILEESTQTILEPTLEMFDNNKLETIEDKTIDKAKESIIKQDSKVQESTNQPIFEDANGSIIEPPPEEKVIADPATNEAETFKEGKGSIIEPNFEVKESTEPLIYDAETIAKANECFIEPPPKDQDNTEPATHEAKTFKEVKKSIIDSIFEVQESTEPQIYEAETVQKANKRITASPPEEQDTTEHATNEAETFQEVKGNIIEPTFEVQESTEPHIIEAEIFEKANESIIEPTSEEQDTTEPDTNKAKPFKESIIEPTFEVQQKTEPPMYEDENFEKANESTIEPPPKEQDTTKPATNEAVTFKEVKERIIEPTFEIQESTEPPMYEAETVEKVIESIIEPTSEEQDTTEPATNETETFIEVKESIIVLTLHVKESTEPQINEAETFEKANENVTESPSEEQYTTEPVTNENETLNEVKGSNIEKIFEVQDSTEPPVYEAETIEKANKSFDEIEPPPEEHDTTEPAINEVETFKEVKASIIEPAFEVQESTERPIYTPETFEKAYESIIEPNNKEQDSIKPATNEAEPFKEVKESINKPTFEVQESTEPPIYEAETFKKANESIIEPIPERQDTTEQENNVAEVNESIIEPTFEVQEITEAKTYKAKTFERPSESIIETILENQDTTEQETNEGDKLKEVKESIIDTIFKVQESIEPPLYKAETIEKANESITESPPEEQETADPKTNEAETFKEVNESIIEQNFEVQESTEPPMFEAETFDNANASIIEPPTEEQDTTEPATHEAVTFKEVLRSIIDPTFEVLESNEQQIYKAETFEKGNESIIEPLPEEQDTTEPATNEAEKFKEVKESIIVKTLKVQESTEPQINKADTFEKAYESFFESPNEEQYATDPTNNETETFKEGEGSNIEPIFEVQDSTEPPVYEAETFDKANENITESPSKEQDTLKTATNKAVTFKELNESIMEPTFELQESNKPIIYEAATFEKANESIIEPLLEKQDTTEPASNEAETLKEVMESLIKPTIELQESNEPSLYEAETVEKPNESIPESPNEEQDTTDPANNETETFKEVKGSIIDPTFEVQDSFEPLLYEEETVEKANESIHESPSCSEEQDTTEKATNKAVTFKEVNESIIETTFELQESNKPIIYEAETFEKANESIIEPLPEEQDTTEPASNEAETFKEFMESIIKPTFEVQESFETQTIKAETFEKANESIIVPTSEEQDTTEPATNETETFIEVKESIIVLTLHVKESTEPQINEAETFEKANENVTESPSEEQDTTEPETNEPETLNEVKESIIVQTFGVQESTEPQINEAETFEKANESNIEPHNEEQDTTEPASNEAETFNEVVENIIEQTFEVQQSINPQTNEAETFEKVNESIILPTSEEQDTTEPATNEDETFQDVTESIIEQTFEVQQSIDPQTSEAETFEKVNESIIVPTSEEQDTTEQPTNETETFIEFKESIVVPTIDVKESNEPQINEAETFEKDNESINEPFNEEPDTTESASNEAETFKEVMESIIKPTFEVQESNEPQINKAETFGKSIENITASPFEEQDTTEPATNETETLNQVKESIIVPTFDNTESTVYKAETIEKANENITESPSEEQDTTELATNKAVTFKEVKEHIIVPNFEVQEIKEPQIYEVESFAEANESIIDLLPEEQDTTEPASNEAETFKEVIESIIKPTFEVQENNEPQINEAETFGKSNENITESPSEEQDTTEPATNETETLNQVKESIIVQTFEVQESTENAIYEAETIEKANKSIIEPPPEEHDTTDPAINEAETFKEVKASIIEPNFEVQESTERPIYTAETFEKANESIIEPNNKEQDSTKPATNEAEPFKEVKESINKPTFEVQESTEPPIYETETFKKANESIIEPIPERQDTTKQENNVADTFKEVNESIIESTFEVQEITEAKTYKAKTFERPSESIIEPILEKQDTTEQETNEGDKLKEVKESIIDTIFRVQESIEPPLYKAETIEKANESITESPPEEQETADPKTIEAETFKEVNESIIEQNFEVQERTEPPMYEAETFDKAYASIIEPSTEEQDTTEPATHEAVTFKEVLTSIIDPTFEVLESNEQQIYKAETFEKGNESIIEPLPEEQDTTEQATNEAEKFKVVKESIIVKTLEVQECTEPQINQADTFEKAFESFFESPNEEQYATDPTNNETDTFKEVKGSNIEPIFEVQDSTEPPVYEAETFDKANENITESPSKEQDTTEPATKETETLNEVKESIIVPTLDVKESTEPQINEAETVEKYNESIIEPPNDEQDTTVPASNEADTFKEVMESIIEPTFEVQESNETQTIKAETFEKANESIIVPTSEEQDTTEPVTNETETFIEVKESIIVLTLHVKGSTEPQINEAETFEKANENVTESPSEEQDTTEPETNEPETLNEVKESIIQPNFEVQEITKPPIYETKPLKPTIQIIIKPPINQQLTTNGDKLSEEANQSMTKQAFEMHENPEPTHESKSEVLIELPLELQETTEPTTTEAEIHKETNETSTIPSHIEHVCEHHTSDTEIPEEIIEGVSEPYFKLRDSAERVITKADRIEHPLEVQTSDEQVVKESEKFKNRNEAGPVTIKPELTKDLRESVMTPSLLVQKITKPQTSEVDIPNGHEKCFNILSFVEITTNEQGINESKNFKKANEMISETLHVEKYTTLPVPSEGEKCEFLIESVVTPAHQLQETNKLYVSEAEKLDETNQEFNEPLVVHQPNLQVIGEPDLMNNDNEAVQLTTKYDKVLIKSVLETSLQVQEITNSRASEAEMTKEHKESVTVSSFGVQNNVEQVLGESESSTTNLQPDKFVTTSDTVDHESGLSGFSCSNDVNTKCNKARSSDAIETISKDSKSYTNQTNIKEQLPNSTVIIALHLDSDINEICSGCSVLNSQDTVSIINADCFALTGSNSTELATTEKENTMATTIKSVSNTDLDTILSEMNDDIRIIKGSVDFDYVIDAKTTDTKEGPIGSITQVTESMIEGFEVIENNKPLTPVIDSSEPIVMTSNTNKVVIMEKTSDLVTSEPLFKTDEKDILPIISDNQNSGTDVLNCFFTATEGGSEPVFTNEKYNTDQNAVILEPFVFCDLSNSLTDDRKKLYEPLICNENAVTIPLVCSTKNLNTLCSESEESVISTNQISNATLVVVPESLDETNDNDSELEELSCTANKDKHEQLSTETPYVLDESCEQVDHLNDKSDEKKHVFAERELYLQLVSNINSSTESSFTRIKSETQRPNYSLQKETSTENDDIKETGTSDITLTDKQIGDSLIDSSIELVQCISDTKNEFFQTIDESFKLRAIKEDQTIVANIANKIKGPTIADQIKQFIFPEMAEYDINIDKPTISKSSIIETEQPCVLTSFNFVPTESLEVSCKFNDGIIVPLNEQSQNSDNVVLSSAKLNRQLDSFNLGTSNVQLLKHRFENSLLSEDKTVKTNEVRQVMSNVPKHTIDFKLHNDGIEHYEECAFSTQESIQANNDVDIECSTEVKPNIIYMDNSPTLEFKLPSDNCTDQNKSLLRHTNTFLGTSELKTLWENSQPNGSTEVNITEKENYQKTLFLDSDCGSHLSFGDCVFSHNIGTNSFCALTSSISSPSALQNEGIKHNLSLESEMLNTNLLTVEQELCEVLSIEDEEMDESIEIEMADIDAMETPDIKDDDLLAFEEKYALEKSLPFIGMENDSSNFLSIENETIDLNIQQEICELDALPIPEIASYQNEIENQHDIKNKRRVIHIDPTLLSFDQVKDELSSFPHEKMDDMKLDELSETDINPHFKNNIELKLTPSREVGVVKPRLLAVDINLLSSGSIENETLDEETQRELQEIDNMSKGMLSIDDVERNGVEKASSAMGFFPETNTPFSLNFHRLNADSDNMPDKRKLISIKLEDVFDDEKDEAFSEDKNVKDLYKSDSMFDKSCSNLQHDMNNYDFFKSSSSSVSELPFHDSSSQVKPFDKSKLCSLEPNLDSLESGMYGAGESYSERLIAFSDTNFSMSTESDSSDFHMWSSNVEFGDAPEVEVPDEMDFDSIISAPNLDEALKKLEMHLQDKGESFQWLSVRTPSPSLQSLEKYFKDGEPCFDTDEFYAEVSGGVLTDTEKAKNDQDNNEFNYVDPGDVWVTPCEKIPECSYTPGSIEVDNGESELQEDENQDWIISPYQYPRVLLANTAQMSIIDEEDDLRKSEPVSPMVKDGSLNSNQSNEEIKTGKSLIILETQSAVDHISEVVQTLKDFDRLTARPSVDEDCLLGEYLHRSVPVGECVITQDTAYNDIISTDQNLDGLADQRQRREDIFGTEHITTSTSEVNIKPSKYDVIEGNFFVTGNTEPNSINVVSFDVTSNQDSTSRLFSNNQYINNKKEINYHNEYEGNEHKLDKAGFLENDLLSEIVKTPISNERNIREGVKYLIEGDIDSIPVETIDDFTVAEKKTYWDKKLQKIQEEETQNMPSSGPKSLSRIKSGTVQELVSCFAEKKPGGLLTSVYNDNQQQKSIKSNILPQKQPTQNEKTFSKFIEPHNEYDRDKMVNSPIRETSISETASMKLVSHWKTYWDDMIHEQREHFDKTLSHVVGKIPSIQISEEEDTASEIIQDNEEYQNDLSKERPYCDNDKTPPVIEDLPIFGVSDTQNVVTGSKTEGSVMRNIKVFSGISTPTSTYNKISANITPQNLTIIYNSDRLSEKRKESEKEFDEQQHEDDNFLNAPMTRPRSFSTGHIDSKVTVESEDKDLKDSTKLEETKGSGEVKGIEIQNDFRIRFERAKQFFKHLETSGPGDIKNRDYRSMPRLDLVSSKTRKPSVDSDSGADTQPKKRRDRYKNRRKKRMNSSKIQSAPTSDTETSKRICYNDSFDSFGGSVKSRKVSERFHVKDLFRDVSGKDGFFKGIPNRAAVLASLRSVDDVRALSPYQIDVANLKSSSSLGSIPSGFQEEYPYLPTTPINRFRPRSVLEFNLIPRSELLDQQF